MKYLALLGLLLLAFACGSKDHGGFVAPETGGAAGRVGAGGGAGKGAAGTSGRVSAEAGEAGEPGTDIDLLAPSTSITSPKEVSDPNLGKPLTAPQVVVTCLATQGPSPNSAKVAPSTVSIAMLGADGKQIGMPASAQSTEMANQYQATFVLTEVPNGPVSFRCSASDVAVPPHSAAVTLSTFVDHGPAVALKNPTPGSAHAVTPAISFRFSTLPDPLIDDDDGAAVTNVALKVYGVDIDDIASHELSKTPGEYKIDVDLSDSKLFNPTPSGPVPVRIVATNKRGTVHTSDFSFNVDSLGPVIQIVSPPTPNQFVGGKVTLAFTVTDTPAGVNPDTVQVILNSQAAFYDPKNGWATPSPNNYTYTFDTRQFGVQIQLNVNIRADDMAGNSSDGASIIYYMDNAPPIVDMAPPDVSELRYDDSSHNSCSASFPPLGDSPKDLDVIGTLTRPRALLWDVGNSMDSQDAFYYSDIDNRDTNTIPHLYFQPDPSKPLLKNSDPSKHGAICNAIADETLPLVTLVPLTPQGASFYSSSSVPPVGEACQAGSETTPPKTICTGTKMTRVIQHESGTVGTPDPVVYVIPPDGLQCTGTQFQITNIAPKDGWICAAVSAIDRTGNRAVSAPLRLCLDSDAYPGEPDCKTMSVPPPTCVSDCVPPPHFGKTTIRIPHG